MPMDAPKIREIFLAALEIPDGVERQAYVDSACGTNAELLNCIRDMLAAHQKAHTPVPEGPTLADTTPPPGAATLPPGTIIDQRYKIIELIAEGGMGAVYRACRVSDMRMEVAIKLVKPGMASTQILQRFNIERQALAIMKHENIAKVLDAGSTREGYPYFVMELVKGLPITKFCDDNKLTVQERLELFEKVCSAVQHAHQKGIVHRDLKPSNILVGLYDDKAVPKVIDFGLAKALYQPITDDILHTKFGTFVGTWQYTAPEQAILNNLDIDTRSDIYSLGVILYELLTGNPPIERSRITHAVMEEVLRIIREEEPPKPSTKIHSSDQRPSIAALRRSEPLQLERQVRGELDWIVMKALEKDRNRRFATASELGADVRRFLAGEAVLSGPVTWQYRLKKFVSKHRGAVLAASLIFTACILGAITTSIGYWKAVQAEKQAKVDLESVTTLLNFIEDDVFSGVDPVERARIGLPAEDNLPVKQLLDRAVSSINSTNVVMHPLIYARLRKIIGKAYYAIGMYHDAKLHINMSIDLMNKHGANREEQGQLNECIGNVELAIGNYETAAKRYDEMFKIYSELEGSTSRKAILAQIKSGLVRKAKAKNPDQYNSMIEYFSNIHEVVRQSPHYDLVVKVRMNLAELQKLKGDLTSAHSTLQDTVTFSLSKLGTDNPTTLAVQNNLAALLMQQGNKLDALEIYRSLVFRAEKVLYVDHPLIALYKNNLASIYFAEADYTKAESMFRESYRVYNKMSPFHRVTLTIRGNMAAIKYVTKDYLAAEEIYREIIPVIVSKHGATRDEHLKLLRDYACVLALLTRDKEADSQMMMLTKVALENNKLDVMTQSITRLKEVYSDAGRLEEYSKIRDNLVKCMKEYRQTKGVGSKAISDAIDSVQ